MAQPTAVGAIPPIPGYRPAEEDTSIMGLLNRMADSLDKLAARLAPESLMLPIVFNNVVAGTIVQTITLPSSGFNGVLMCLTAGVIDMYFGSSATGVIPDMTLTGGSNPIYIPLPPQNERQVMVKVNSLSPVNAVGTLYLIQY